MEIRIFYSFKMMQPDMWWKICYTTRHLNGWKHRWTIRDFPTIQSVFFPVIRSYFRGGSVRVDWGFSEGSEGVQWGLGGVNLSEPPLNPQSTPFEYKTEAFRIRWMEHQSTTTEKSFCQYFSLKDRKDLSVPSVKIRSFSTTYPVGDLCWNKCRDFKLVGKFYLP